MNCNLENPPDLTVANIIDLFRCIGNAGTGHKDLNGFFVGDEFRLNGEKDKDYPMLFLEIGSFSWRAIGAREAGQIAYDFAWYIFDRAGAENPDREWQAALNKCRDIAEQIIMRLIKDSKSHDCCTDTTWEIGWNWSITPITDEAQTFRLGDDVTGVRVQFTIEGYVSSLCTPRITCENLFNCCFCQPSST